MVSGNTLSSAHGGVGYLQPGGRVSSLSSSSSQHRAAFVGLASTSSSLFRPLRASPSSSSILQHLKVKASKVHFSAVVSTIFVFNTHSINRISKAGAAIVNTISSHSNLRNVCTDEKYSFCIYVFILP